MYLIDGPDTVPAKPAKKPAETAPGWFDGGNPVQNLKATMVTRDWLNMIQDEIGHVIEEGGLAMDRNDDHQLATAIRKLVVAVVNTSQEIHIETIPVGTIIAYYGTEAPEGYLACDAGQFDALLYPNLYALLGKNTVPDLRGCFLRGTGGNAAALGVKQQDAGRNVTGAIDWQMNSLYGSEQGALYNDRSSPDGVKARADSNGSHRLMLDAERCWGSAHTANEFRPVNVAILYCIKHD
jgi:hypothetical protein